MARVYCFRVGKCRNGVLVAMDAKTSNGLVVEYQQSRMESVARNKSDKDEYEKGLAGDESESEVGEVLLLTFASMMEIEMFAILQQVKRQEECWRR